MYKRLLALPKSDQHEGPSPMDSPGKFAKEFQPAFSFNPLYQRWEWLRV